MERTRGGQIAWWVGLVAHLLAVFWYGASGLVAPTWAVTVLLVIWAVLLAVGLKVRKSSPYLMLLIPVLDAIIWFAAISAGERFLHWTALGPIS
jgi:hypothetical protein